MKTKKNRIIGGRNRVIVDLSAEELEQIRSWYLSARGESATTEDKAEWDLAQKLGCTGQYDECGGFICSWCGCQIQDRVTGLHNSFSEKAEGHSADCLTRFAQ
jgi:hypothetical protein